MDQSSQMFEATIAGSIPSTRNKTSKPPASLSYFVKQISDFCRLFFSEQGCTQICRIKEQGLLRRYGVEVQNGYKEVKSKISRPSANRRGSLLQDLALRIIV
eukprot:gnl/TRDRNA2_/TRDRNA2_156164_c2_seq2.p1 gnl/TRDRNA2_/TRDRNA2_156164_c2~~gnl/TRDRNA2_/TRDRNA2_156164_c2_seq2.p1  ORF type:complete len:102 (+),score=8.57 gnl/TRDRNA2_/TRDRNA2_156164_c2_seq2:33-338(+)